MAVFQCPHCGSGDIQKCEMIYMNGTVNHSSTTTIGNYESETSGQASTSLAQSVAPPTQKEEHWIATAVCGFITVMIVHGLWKDFTSPFGHGIHTGHLIAALIFGAFTWAFYTMTQEATEYNEKQFPLEYDEWKNSYVCFRCGNRFRL